MVKRVLILDDMLSYAAQHKLKLEEAGIQCEYTQCGYEAVEMMTEDGSPFKVMLVDEILLEPNGQTQHFQGRDVRDEIRKKRNDTLFIVITSKPQKEREKWFQEGKSFSAASLPGDRVEATIRHEPQVVQLIPKSLLDDSENQDETYDRMILQIRALLKKQPATSFEESSQVLMPGIFIGLGIRKEMAQRSKPISLAKFFQLASEESPVSNIELSRTIRSFRRNIQASEKNFVLEKKVFYLKPGLNEYKPLEMRERGRRRPRSVIGVTTRYFDILEYLAWKTEMGEEAEIRGDQYLYDIRGYTRPVSCEDISEEYIEDSNEQHQKIQHQKIQSIRDSQGLNEQQKVSIENINRRRYHNLSVAIHHLGSKLVEAGIGFDNRKQIFTCYDGETLYKPLFKVGIVIYPVPFS